MAPNARILISLLMTAGLIAGCKNLLPEFSAPTDAGVSGEPIPSGPGVGTACKNDKGCRDGLVCDTASGTCKPGGNSIVGAGCLLSAECTEGNYCSPFGLCAPSGKAKTGESCSQEGDCVSGLTCGYQGIVGTCAKPGTGDVGKACVAPSDCQAGLICYSGTCQALRGVKFWAGPKCEPQTSDAKILFKIPRAGEPASEDFYRLPFPNDIRKKGGKISLAGHPKPGAGFLPLDAVDMVARLIEEDATGFSTNPVVYFRFSRTPNLGSIGPAVEFYNITPGSPEYGFTIGHSWNGHEGTDSKYLCEGYLAVSPPTGLPLRPGTTYAVVIKKGITDKEKQEMGPDADFTAMLGSAAPADADLAAAWTAYAPLRAWIADKKIAASDLAAAAVFTTEASDTMVARLRMAVQAAPAPVVKGFVRCGDGPSPCGAVAGVDGERGCPRSPDPAFDEYQATVSIPGFQQGKPPFESALDGGGIVTDASGNPRVQRTEDVCVSLTVPKGTPPAAGWPLVIYGHGTGGGYRSHVESRLAADLAAGTLSEGAAVPMAMLGYDGVLHGPRKGGSMKDEGELVFNLLNPRAARDNSMQAAADLFALVRGVPALAAAGAKVDKAKLAYYGHSQGGNAGGVGAGYEPGFGAVVLSGTGGLLRISILEKKNPVGVGGLLPLLLGEFTRVTELHPVLNLMQMYFDRSDPVNHARRIVAEPPKDVMPRHLLHILGTEDTYSPVTTQLRFASAAGIGVMAPVVEKHGLGTVEAPAKGNALIGMTRVTAVQTQYQPAGYDGHFVSTENTSARRSLRDMLGTHFRDGMPTARP